MSKPKTLRITTASVQEAEERLARLPEDLARALRQSWQLALAGEQAFAADFYRNLFELAPQVVELFPGEMGAQQERLTHTLGECIALAEKPEELLLLLRASGARHHHYRTEIGHFVVMREALLNTLEQRLGNQFDQSMRQAWSQFFDAMSIVMCGALKAYRKSQ